MPGKNRLLLGIVGLSAVMLSPGCASFNPTPVAEVGFKNRAQTLVKDNLTVTAGRVADEDAAVGQQ